MTESQTTEAEYIRLTDLTKLRIVRHILCDVMKSSLPQRDSITRIIAGCITYLEELSDG